MKTWPKHPVIYEINTWVWLRELRPEIPDAHKSIYCAAWGVGCNCLLRIRLRVVDGRLATEPCRD